MGTQPLENMEMATLEREGAMLFTVSMPARSPVQRMKWNASTKWNASQRMLHRTAMHEIAASPSISLLCVLCHAAVRECMHRADGSVGASNGNDGFDGGGGSDSGENPYSRY